MSTLRSIRGREILLGPKLRNASGGVAEGGEGAIFSIQGNADQAVKVYHARNVAPEKRRKLRQMVSIASAGLLRHTAWPVDLIEDQVFGIIMPRAAGHELHDVYGPKSRMLKLPHARFRFLATTAFNLCAAVHEIHATGAVIGDFNQRNILIGEKAGACFVDCDSFQTRAGAEVFRCLVGTPENLAPEAHGQNFETFIRTANQDNFTLAVLIFQLLFLGRHPFAGIGGREYELPEAIQRHLYAYGAKGALAGIKPPEAVPKLDLITPAMAALFERAFAPAGNSGGRPLPSEWGTELRPFVGNLIQCRTNASHEYNSLRGSCPWCELYGKLKVSFFVIDGDHAFRIDATSITELANRILALEPLNLSAPRPTASQVVAAVPPSYSSISGKFLLGFPLLAFAVWMLAIGGWFIAIPCGWWAFSLLLGGEGQAKRTAHRKQLETAYRDAQRQLGFAEQRIQSIRNEYSRDFERQKSSVRSFLNEYRNLPTTRLQQIESLNRRLKELQLEEFLDRRFIAHASISGIGPGRRAALAAYGIETAADIGWKMQVPGFGPSLTGNLVAWRMQQEQHFRFDPSKKLDPREIQKVDAALLVRKQELEGSISEAKGILERITRQAREKHTACAREFLPIVTAVEKGRVDLEAFNQKYPS